MVASGQVYLRLSDVIACRGGTAQLIRTSGVISARFDGIELTIWPWGEPVAVVGGLERVPLPELPWFWLDGGFYVHPELLEAAGAGGIGIDADVAGLRLRPRAATAVALDTVLPEPATGLKILIDPGHGGQDLGASDAAGNYEKDLVLAIAHRLHAMLLARGYRSRLTRVDDSYPTLSERVVMANEWDADLMLSLHLNSAPRSTAKGIETYVLSREASDPRAKALAQFENAYDAEQAGQGGDSVLELLLNDVARGEQENLTQRLAPAFHAALVSRLNTENRGVRRAPFFVLAGTTMPAFLVELGFLSNSEESRELTTPEYQAQLAAGLAAAVDAIAPYLNTRTGGRP